MEKGYKILEESDLTRDFVYIPSIDLHVAKQKTLQGKKWEDSCEILHSKGQRMLTIPEFVEFLKYAKSNFPEIYEEIVAVRSPWRAEWLDAGFEVIKGKLHLNSMNVYKDERLISKISNVLDEDTLMEDRISGISLDYWLKNPTKDGLPGISLDYWLKNPTRQGLPRKNIENGDLFYWSPGSNNNSFAGFTTSCIGAGLFCNRYSSNQHPAIGVRAAIKID